MKDGVPDLSFEEEQLLLPLLAEKLTLDVSVLSEAYYECRTRARQSIDHDHSEISEPSVVSSENSDTRPLFRADHDAGHSNGRKRTATSPSKHVSASPSSRVQRNFPSSTAMARVPAAQATSPQLVQPSSYGYMNQLRQPVPPQQPTPAAHATYVNQSQTYHPQYQPYSYLQSPGTPQMNSYVGFPSSIPPHSSQHGYAHMSAANPNPFSQQFPASN